jgi:hypothetical protein
LAVIEVILLNLLAVGRILLKTFVALVNPVDNLYLDRSWPSVNFFSGSIFIPRFNMAKAFPFWLRPAQIRRLEWNAIRILVSLSKGIHIAVDVEKLNVGFIIEEVVRDRSKHRAAERPEADLGFDTHNGNGSTKRRRGGRGGQPQQKQQQTPQNVRDARSKKRRAKEKVEYFSNAFRGAMETLKGYGVNIAVNMDEIGVGMDFTKLELDGTITRSDDWWEQGTHIRALDVGLTLSTGRSASFVSWEVLELRFLEEEDSEYDDEEDEDEEDGEESDDEDSRYFHLTPAGGEGDTFSDAGGGTGAPAAGGGDGDDDLARVQQDIARQLFEDGSDTNSTVGGVAGGRHMQGVRPSNGNGKGKGRGRTGKGKRPKDNFARALEDAPLLSLSSFSCGANVFLELAQMDFSSRTAMMSKYGEIKRLYRTTNQYSASGPVGTSASAHFARRKHQHIRGEMPGGAFASDYDYDEEEEEDGAGGVVAMGNASRVWGMTMSAVAVSVFYAYAKAKANK